MWVKHGDCRLESYGQCLKEQLKHFRETKKGVDGEMLSQGVRGLNVCRQRLKEQQ